MDLKEGGIVSFGGEPHKIIKVGSRNELSPLPGVTLIGDAVVIQNSKGEKFLVYDFDLED